MGYELAAVVPAVKLNCTLALGPAEVGIEQVAVNGHPETLRFTLSLNPFTGARVIVDV
jgi:hypothetical protein